MTLLLVPAWILMLSSPIDAQRETIPELVARGAVSSVATVPSGPTPTVTDLLRQADVVVTGVIGESRSYLSKDQRDIYTDYPITDPVFLFQSRVRGASAPGMVPTVTVTQRGGTVIVNGAKFTEKQPALAPLEQGTDALFLLQQVGGKYLIAGTFFGAFDISSGTLKPLAARSDFAPEYRNVPISDAIKSMMGIIRALGRSPGN